MTAQRSHHRSRHWLAAGQAGVRLGRLATVLAAAVLLDRKLVGRRGATATTG